MKGTLTIFICFVRTLKRESNDSVYSRVGWVLQDIRGWVRFLFIYNFVLSMFLSLC